RLWRRGVCRLCATLHDNHQQWETCHSQRESVRRRIERKYRGEFPVGGNGHPSEAETTACVWCRHTRGMKPVKVVAQVAYVLNRIRRKWRGPSVPLMVTRGILG